MHWTLHGALHWAAWSVIHFRCVPQGEHLKEAAKINSSLSTLGRVIKSLVEVQAKNVGTHVPYRDSKLTFLLQVGKLGGPFPMHVLHAQCPLCTQQAFDLIYISKMYMYQSNLQKRPPATCLTMTLCHLPSRFDKTVWGLSYSITQRPVLF